jgi:hypothetical protein
MLNIPAFAWQLFPAGSAREFLKVEHEEGYRRARRELCRTIYGPRMYMRTKKLVQGDAMFLPPPGGFLEPDPFVATEENQEIVRAVTEDDPTPV